MIRDATFDELRFLGTLRQLVRLAPRLQNAPSAGLVPQEALAVEVVEEVLRPHLDCGFLQIERVSAPGNPDRPNLIITLEGHESGELGLVGAHFDVVVADREKEGWLRDPFELTVEDGVLYGRGTTDCLGHVALLTELAAALAEAGQRPRRRVTIVLIANEETSPVSGIGMDHLVETGRLDRLRRAPLFWIDSADFGPTVGTGGVARWRLQVTGVPGHSGMTHNCVNALELAMASTLYLREQFERLVPEHPDERRYGFSAPSTFKPTIVEAPSIGVSSIPGSARIEGDVRLTPFHEVADVLGQVTAVAEDLAKRIERNDAPSGFPRVRTADGKSGRIEFSWLGEAGEGLACDLDSPALAALESAMRRIRGKAERYSMTGSLPLVRDLQRRGFDVHITGFGQAEYYHAPDERARLADFADGFSILRDVVSSF